jgi:putative SOS response-associated peptidase YedK
MCARYTLTLDQARLVIAGLVHIFAFAPRYNIGPAQRVPVILDTAEGVKAVEMRWGIPSAWSKALHINAQAENIHQTTTFKPLLGQRCLVPMDGFYEWKPDKSPVRFVRRRRELFCVAGLWKELETGGAGSPLPADALRAREREKVAAGRMRVEGKNISDGAHGVTRHAETDGTSRSFVLLTTAANPSVAPIHDRMPFIIRDDQLDRWLNNSGPQLPSSIFHLLDKNPLDFYAVSHKVNNVRNEHPDLICRAEGNEGGSAPAPVERELF